MTKEIPLGLSFAHIKPGLDNHVGGIVIYYNTPEDKRNTAFVLAIEPERVEGLMHILNHYIAPSIEHMLEL